MKEVEAIRGQSLWDIALQHCGDADLAEEIAQLNGLDPNTVFAGGETLAAPDGDLAAAARLAAEGVVPVTGDDGPPERGPVDVWEASVRLVPVGGEESPATVGGRENLY